jgi:hypothetical protein
MRGSLPDDLLRHRHVAVADARGRQPEFRLLVAARGALEHLERSGRVAAGSGVRDRVEGAFHEKAQVLGCGAGRSQRGVAHLI